MRITLALACALACALAAGAASAQDPLKSAACGAALQNLESARGAKAAPRDIEAARHAAAATCLGSGDPPKRPSRVARAPDTVPPPTIEPPVHARLLPPPVVSQPPPPVGTERPAQAAHCDPGGCWVPGATHLRPVVPPMPGHCLPQPGGGMVCP